MAVAVGWRVLVQVSTLSEDLLSISYTCMMYITDRSMDGRRESEAHTYTQTSHTHTCHATIVLSETQRRGLGRKGMNTCFGFFWSVKASCPAGEACEPGCSPPVCICVYMPECLFAWMHAWCTNTQINDKCTENTCSMYRLSEGKADGPARSRGNEVIFCSTRGEQVILGRSCRASSLGRDGVKLRVNVSVGADI